MQFVLSHRFRSTLCSSNFIIHFHVFSNKIKRKRNQFEPHWFAIYTPEIHAQSHTHTHTHGHREKGNKNILFKYFWHAHDSHEQNFHSTRSKQKYRIKRTSKTNSGNFDIFLGSFRHDKNKNDFLMGTFCPRETPASTHFTTLNRLSQDDTFSRWIFNFFSWAELFAQPRRKLS